MCTMCILVFMSQPITARLDEDVVQAIDNAVACGVAPNRGAIISRAVREWLSHHSEEAIKDSYRKRYEAIDPDEQELIAKLGISSATIAIESNK
ncbi:hypothetical protein AXFE_36660 [Acidithrix ferrooxidans]|uniref:Ribbon-helix-helix protein CopG domain-containing protein n=2 Tax=Acidimicrobiaceae TaxID=84994 RepID=A0A0D8HC34_9ACTN|nr:hypothetical protein AXFE_36660 [Acidithrix ferrooxidans]